MGSSAATGAPDAGEPAGMGAILEQANDPMIVIEPNGAIVRWNQAATSAFGHAEHEVLGKNVAEVFDAPRLRTLSRGIDRLTGPHVLETPVRHREGHLVWTETSVSRIDLYGRSRLLLVARDVSGRVRGQEDELRRRKEMEDSIASLEAFAYVVSHDLKEPVRAMGIYLDEVLHHPEDEEREDLLRRAAEANRSLDRLLRGLLEWSRTATQPVQPRVLRVQDVLKDAGCAAQFDSLVRERHATLDVAPDIPPVLASESLLCRVFGNLVTNAIRHNPRPDPLVRVRSLPPPAPRLVRVAVEDNGPGLPAEAKARFERLAEKPTTFHGGFGLAIARRALDRLGGRMGVETPPEGGTRFLLDLPAAPTGDTLEERVRELV